MYLPPLAIPLLFSIFCNGEVFSTRSPTTSSAKLSARDDCFNPDPQDTLTDRMNIALNSSGQGFVLSLCPNTEYKIFAPINFAAPSQEISTKGYPTDDSRAMITVAGPISNGTGHSTAIQGGCKTCNNIKLRNIQINGSREDTIIDGGANIEMGGPTSGQLIEYVRSFNPRSWSCLHIAEGSLLCNNATVQNNDIGPCGTDSFQQWADGISFACANGLVRNNMIDNPTDGGIVLFGSPGTLVENNTIWIEEQTLLGGINLVDYLPWSGNFTDVVVRNNSIFGGFATDSESASSTKGDDQFDAIIKIGIAIGPRVWFGNRYGNNKSENGTVTSNHLSGAFGYGIALTSAKNFTVQSNDLFGNTSFIGSKGPNCSNTDSTPVTQQFVIDKNTTQSSNVQSDFVAISDGDSLTCIQPPDGGDFWPYGGSPETTGQAGGERSGNSTGDKVGIALGVILGIIFVAALAWFIRRWALARSARQGIYGGKGFVRGNF
ncbi:uncharacterized protein FOMMEDRAFT_126269 [Fomitiporia mediterranea MF3/22]|uniref:uncharacterized protein n=1 Tax=Fomitiporia mediterranea (strain MF3/22) TaxID=694068 RepID=UPI0004408388|nr:uncharacterized protein FOMMEDRAFT_126269 [Fomitiporia mediterranea MF3/22]EJD01389.1 hypothetical protein FOMMEDRAFT_126269 [Fomitiporia mediterranea MF3/22]